MPSLKRDVSSAPDRTGFEAYSGPTPKQQGLYRAEVKKFDYKKFNSGSTGFRVLVELVAPEGNPRSEFDGYPQWVNIVFGDKEAMQAREKALYKAYGNTDGKPNIKLGEGDIENGDAVPVISLDGKKTIGAFVKVDLQHDNYQGEARMTGDAIYRSIDDAPGGSGVSAVKVEVASDEDDMLEDGEDEVSFEERTAELKKMGIVDLRKLASGDYDLETKGVKKPELIEAILDQEFGAAALAEDEDEDEEDEEVEIDEEEEGEEEDDEDEEEEEDESEARLAELLELDRAGIKAALKAADPAFKVLKKHTDEELAQAVVDAEFGEDGDEDEDGEPPF